MIIFRNFLTVANMSNCIICFSDFEDGKRYTCCDPRCTESICFDCLTRYIDISVQENTLPTCPREKCEGVFDEKAVDKTLVSKFRNLLYNHYRLVKTGAIEALKKQRTVVQILKDEKMKFILENMPKAVKKVAEITFMGRLNKIRKVQAGREAGRISRTCINLVCNGFLNEEFQCTKCKTQFCKDCEEIKEDAHTCKQEVIESLKIVNNMVSCPSCKTKIEKSEGCMAMTCAVCKTNFWYNTGEKGDAGNHGAYVDVTLRNTISLSTEYHDYIPPRYVSSVLALEREVLKFNEGKFEDAIDRMLLGSYCSVFKLSEVYSDMVRGSINVAIASKKLILLEKILQKREPGYEGEISKIFDESQPVSVSRVISRDKDNLFVELPRLFENLHIAGETMNVAPIEIKKAMETGNGIIKGFYWERA